MTRERGSLVHDDRLDALAGACSIFSAELGVDPEGVFMSREEERREQELEDLFAEADEVAGYAANDNTISRHVAKAARPTKR